VLAGTAIAVLCEAGKAGIANPGAHGFSEILYAFTSAANNNGSAFAGLSANTPFYNSMLAIAMWFGRFAVIVPILAIAGSLAGKQRLEANSGTLPTHGAMFIGLLSAWWRWSACSIMSGAGAGAAGRTPAAVRQIIRFHQESLMSNLPMTQQEITMFSHPPMRKFSMFDAGLLRLRWSMPCASCTRCSCAAR
jgi:hypothetical protein